MVRRRTLGLSLAAAALAAFAPSDRSWVTPAPRRTAPESLAGQARPQKRQPQQRRPRTQAGSLGSIWASTGIGPAASGIWARLAVVAPFSWIDWLAIQFANAPAFYRYYIYYIVASKMAQKFAPGLHCQVVTGTQLGMLKTVSIDKYKEAVSRRLADLLVAQAKLRTPKGQPAQELPPAMLQAAMEKVKQDNILADALGSSSALSVWHKLERTPLSDPNLLKDAKPGSQIRWILDALRKDYTDDLEEAAQFATTKAAAKDVEEALKALNKAVDVAAQKSQLKLVEAGADDGMKEVQEASMKSAKAISHLEEAMRQDPGQEVVSQQRRSAWEVQSRQLLSTYESVPEVTAVLRRLGATAPAEAPRQVAPPPATAPTTDAAATS